MHATLVPFSKPNQKLVDQILGLLSNFHPLSKELKHAFSCHALDLTLKQGAYLMHQDKPCHEVYFLVSGMVSAYRKEGSTKTVAFINIGGDFIAPINGLYGSGPAGETVIAEEDCYLVGISAITLLQFFEQFPEMNIVMRKILESHYKEAHTRALINKMGTATAKYAYYYKNYPHHHHKVTDNLLAKFLDIKPRTLQNIKRKHELTQRVDRLTTDLQLQSLHKAITQDLIFQQKSITLKAIADQVNLSSHQLSSLINEHYQQNFTDFINTYRVNFVKDQLKSKSNFQQTTIEALGYEAGFSSKSTFFSVFKKQTGLSPLCFANAMDELLL